MIEDEERFVSIFFWVLFVCFIGKFLSLMMDVVKSKKRRNSIIENLVLSLPFPKGKAKSSLVFLSKSKSWHRTAAETSSNSNKTRQNFVAPNGCFSVYVGPEKQRFVIKAKYANHPLFKMLLEDAEKEYGFNCEGPFLLPCDVDLFYKVLAEMDNSGEEIHLGCGSCSPFTAARRLGNSSMAKGYSSYGLLTPPRLLKINQF